MLTAEENAQLTNVGPGTLMGDLMRRYWIPVVLSTEVAPGGRVKRVRILGEDLVVFAAPAAGSAWSAELCAHRRASLYFARNEERGLRCVYHGWQYESSGRCVDMPNERAESNFQDKVILPAYPCAERGGVVWAYMGPAARRRGCPISSGRSCRSRSASSPSSGRTAITCRPSREAWTPLTSRFSTASSTPSDDQGRRALDQAAAGFGFASQLERAPHIEVADTETGLVLGARRDAPAGPVLLAHHPVSAPVSHDAAARGGR